MTEHPADRVVPFADGPETWAEAVVAAPADVVWRFVADPDTPAAFSDEFRGADWLEGDGPAVVARFRGRNGRGDTTWETEGRITDCEPGRILRYDVHHDGAETPLATWTFELEDLADGTTRLRQHTKLGPGRSGLTWAIRNAPDAEMAIIADRLAGLRANMQATVDGIAGLAQAEVRASS